jgi:type VI secretion system protein ImpL
LTNVTQVANQYRESTPFTMRWGLYQGRSMSNVAKDAYARELNAGLLPAVAQHFANRLTGFAGEPDKLYQYLKAYLMLGQPEHLEPAQLGFLADLEWQRVFANDPLTLERVNRHFNALIADGDRVQPASLDQGLVDRARTSLKQASLPVLMYSRLKLNPNDAEHDRYRQSDRPWRRCRVRAQEWRSLSEPIPAPTRVGVQ